MKKQKFTETQIVAFLKQYEGGREALDVCREYGYRNRLLAVVN
jgi:putative transposase